MNPEEISREKERTYKREGEGSESQELAREGAGKGGKSLSLQESPGIIL